MNTPNTMPTLSPRAEYLLSKSPKLADFYDANKPETYAESWELWYEANTTYWRLIDQATHPTLPAVPALTHPGVKNPFWKGIYTSFLAGQGRAILICVIIFEILLIILKETLQ